jgi:hypothetical protein
MPSHIGSIPGASSCFLFEVSHLRRVIAGGVPFWVKRHRGASREQVDGREHAFIGYTAIAWSGLKPYL